jgi:hypothetical protein
MATQMQVQNQLEQFTKLLADQGLIDASKTGDATAQAQLMLSQMNFAPPKAKRSAKIVAIEDRCIARVWGDGSGKDQCKSSKCEGSKFCKRCARNFEKCSTPMTRKDGKRFGLYLGTIETPISELIFDATSGEIAMAWKNDQSRAIITQALADGTSYHPSTREYKSANRVKSDNPKAPRKKKAKAPKAKRTPNAYMLFLNANRQAIKDELTSAGQDPKVAAVAKAAGAKWRNMSTEDKEPFVTKANQLKTEAKAAAADKASLSIVSEVVEEVVVNTASRPTTPPSTPTDGDLSQFDRRDELVSIMLNGINNDGSIDPNAKPIAKTSDEIAQDGNDDVFEEEDDVVLSVHAVEAASDDEDGDELEVEPHTLADGTQVLKSDDNEIYDKDSFELLGTWNANTNSLA